MIGIEFASLIAWGIWLLCRFACQGWPMRRREIRSSVTTLRGQHFYTYRWDLLKLALDHVEKLDHHHYELVPLSEKVTQWRAEQLLISGKVDGAGLCAQ